VVLSLIILFQGYQIADAHDPVDSGKPNLKEDCLAAQTNNECNVDIIPYEGPKDLTDYFLPRVMMIPNNSTVVWQNHDNVTHNISGLSSDQVEKSKDKNVKRYGKENILMVGMDSGDIKPSEKFELKIEKPGYLVYYDKYFPERKGHIFVYPETAQINVDLESVLSIPKGIRHWVTGMAFAPDGKLFFTEFVGDVKILDNGKLLDEPFVKNGDPKFFANEDGETPIYDEEFPVIPFGWMGVGIDPDFEENHFVYLARQFKVLDGKSPDNAMFQTKKMQLIRFTELNNTATDMKILIDEIGSIEHTGGPIIFGQDGTIFFSTGDNANGFDSQDISKLTGKILRINTDGTIPEDNPFENSPVFAYGFRNVFGIDAHPITGEIFVSENGPDRGDELNRVLSGKNYGWPVYTGNFLVSENMIRDKEEYTEPILEWQQTLGPSNLIIYDGDKLEPLKNNLIVGTYNLGTLRMITFDEAIQNVETEQLLFAAYKPVMAVAEGPDGFVYFSTLDGIERIVGISNSDFSSLKPFELGYSQMQKNEITKFYGKGPVDDSDPNWPGKIIQTAIKGDSGVIIASTSEGIKLVRIKLSLAQLCEEQKSICIEGKVSGLKNTEHPAIGDNMKITINLETKTQTISMVTGMMEGTNTVIHLQKIIIK